MKKSRKKDRGRRSPHPEPRHKRQRGGGRDQAQSHAHPKTLRATVDKNRKGFAFLILENKKNEDIFIPPPQARDLFHGDRVEIQIDRRGRLEGLRVLEHRFKEVMGRFLPSVGPQFLGRGPKAENWKKRRGIFPENGVGKVIYERKNAREEIIIPKMDIKVQAGDWVRVKLTFNEGNSKVTGEILEAYGQTLPPSADVPMVAAEYGLDEDHSLAAIAEARGKTLDLSELELKHRKDLRKMPFITIDGETARDFDDAVFVEREKSGYILWVAIADVSHYVTEGSALDREAFGRGTSVYFPERAFHMLPGALSENLCSLKPNEPRMALVAKMTFDREAKRTHTEVMEAVIESKRRATYNQLQDEWQANKKDSKWEFSPHFALYEGLREMRKKRGSLDFELPEAEVNVTPDGEVLSIRNRSRLETHRLIEEFMIAANEAVTEWMMEREQPFVYRIHEEPSGESLQKFQALAATVGIRLSLDAGIAPKILSELITRLEGHPAQAMLNTALLRSMKQAIYSATHGIHYGLASSAYTHFTSPIRRYPDLVVHRLLRSVLRGGRNPGRSEAQKADRSSEKNRGHRFTRDSHDGAYGPSSHKKSRKQVEDRLAEICDHCSYRERLAADAERDSIKIKQTRIMAKHLGEEFPGKIVGMITSGLFVQINDPFVEGLISVDSMDDDVYEFNEERMIFFGRRKKRTFKMGDPVQVKVVRTDLDKRQIDFTMVE